MTSPGIPANVESSDDVDDGRDIVALALPSIFISDVSTKAPEPAPEVAEVAMAWQKLALYQETVESAVLKGVQPGRMAEIVGRAAAAGEQLSLAWTYSE